MTDKKIIKALENVRYHLPAGEHKAVIDDAIECINRQQNAIKELQKTIDILHEEIADFEVEINNQYEIAVADIKSNIADSGTSCHWCMDITKAKAIKEFADKLKAEHSTPDILMPFNWISIEDTALDELVAEMVGTEE